MRWPFQKKGTAAAFEILRQENARLARERDDANDLCSRTAGHLCRAKHALVGEVPFSDLPGHEEVPILIAQLKEQLATATKERDELRGYCKQSWMHLGNLARKVRDARESLKRAYEAEPQPAPAEEPKTTRIRVMVGTHPFTERPNRRDCEVCDQQASDPIHLPPFEYVPSAPAEEPGEEPVEAMEEGGACPRPGCDGVLELPIVEDCSCHISPPCAACTDSLLVCTECDPWDWEDDGSIDDSQGYIPAGKVQRLACPECSEGPKKCKCAGGGGDE